MLLFHHQHWPRTITISAITRLERVMLLDGMVFHGSSRSLILLIFLRKFCHHPDNMSYSIEWWCDGEELISRFLKWCWPIFGVLIFDVAGWRPPPMWGGGGVFIFSSELGFVLEVPTELCLTWSFKWDCPGFLRRWLLVIVRVLSRSVL